MASKNSPLLFRTFGSPNLMRSDSVRAWQLLLVPSSVSYTRSYSARKRAQACPRPHHYPIQKRSLTTSPILLGGRGASHTVDRKRGKTESRLEKKMFEQFQARQPSIRVRMRDMFRSDDVPEDLGLFPGTLIMPTGADVPNILHLKRLKMEYQRSIKRVKDVFTLIAMKWALGFRKHRIQFRRSSPTAMALHKQVYSALADGDEAEIRRITTDGVRNELINQIQSRSDDSTYYWDLVRYIGRPRVVSHRATRMPIPDDSDDTTSMIRQAVVKIGSVQRLTKENLDAVAQNGTGSSTPADTEKAVTEYVVIQKRVLRGVEEPWKFWGTVEQTKVDEFDETLETKAPASASM